MSGRDGHLRRGRGLGAWRRGPQRGKGSLDLTPFFSALSFLTIFPAVFPAAGIQNLAQRDISNARAYYPAVGLLLGLLLVGIEKGTNNIFPVPLTAALLLAVMAAVTRGLHLDGFMDVCDGLFGGYTVQRRLEIMRDSHVGAFAVVGAVSLLILKYGALVSLLSLNVPGKEWVLLLFPTLSRWSMVVQLGLFPYVRRQGLGSPLHQGTAKLATGIAAVSAIAASGLLGGIGGSGLLVGSTVLAWLLGLGMSRMLGGLTGDTYGATNEIVEVVGLMAAVALLPLGWIEPLWQLLGVA